VPEIVERFGHLEGIENQYYALRQLGRGNLLFEPYRRAHTFYEEYEPETYSGYYLPEDVLVLVSPWTSSSGLDMTLYLYRAGATPVGT